MRNLIRLATLASLLSGCSDTVAPERHTFSIAPRSIELAEGHSRELRLTTSLPDDVLVGHISWHFVPDDPEQGSHGVGIESAGPRSEVVRVSGWAPAAGRVVASYYGWGTDTVQLMVRGVSVARMTLEPAGGSLRVGTFADLVLDLMDSAGTRLQRTVAWSSSDSSIATVEYWPEAGYSRGLTRVWAHRPGPVTLTATFDTVAASAEFEILP